MNSGNEIVNQLRADEKAIQEKLEKLRKPIAQLEADLQHIQGAIAFYQRSSTSNKTVIEEQVIVEGYAAIPVSRLKGLSHSDAAIAIAKYNGGIVRTQEAKGLMIKAGIMSRTKNSTNMAHNAINRTDKFERIAPGEYRLKEANLKLELSDTLHVPN
jgi:hypothetical protein